MGLYERRMKSALEDSVTQASEVVEGNWGRHNTRVSSAISYLERLGQEISLSVGTLPSPGLAEEEREDERLLQKACSQEEVKQSAEEDANGRQDQSNNVSPQNTQPESPVIRRYANDRDWLMMDLNSYGVPMFDYRTQSKKKKGGDYGKRNQKPFKKFSS
eukprot:TRINITY_DN6553_c0_g4_i3.p1 TRINITY_DN6553_c0_g4~~TRINITY_DN6553_c0_g4_i3.p1  ORF type:complete len:160 (-),score=43.46 TRINITY_DN6553_c0_g4_i3:119-598(-)